MIFCIVPLKKNNFCPLYNVEKYHVAVRNSNYRPIILFSLCDSIRYNTLPFSIRKVWNVLYVNDILKLDFCHKKGKKLKFWKELQAPICLSQWNIFRIISYQLFLLHHKINLQLNNLGHYHGFGDNDLLLLQEIFVFNLLAMLVSILWKKIPVNEKFESRKINNQWRYEQAASFFFYWLFFCCC